MDYEAAAPEQLPPRASVYSWHGTRTTQRMCSHSALTPRGVVRRPTADQQPTVAWRQVTRLDDFADCDVASQTTLSVVDVAFVGLKRVCHFTVSHLQIFLEKNLQN